MNKNVNPEWEKLKQEVRDMLTIEEMKILITELMEKAYTVGYKYGKSA